MKVNTLTTVNYSTDDESDLVLCRRGDMWTIGISTGRKVAEIEVPTELAELIGDFLPRPLQPTRDDEVPDA